MRLRGKSAREPRAVSTLHVETSKFFENKKVAGEICRPPTNSERVHGIRSWRCWRNLLNDTLGLAYHAAHKLKILEALAKSIVKYGH